MTLWTLVTFLLSKINICYRNWRSAVLEKKVHFMIVLRLLGEEWLLWHGSRINSVVLYIYIVFHHLESTFKIIVLFRVDRYCKGSALPLSYGEVKGDWEKLNNHLILITRVSSCEFS